MSGPTAGWWDYDLTDDATGRHLVQFGGTQNDLGTAVQVTTVSTGSRLNVGTWPLTFKAVHRNGTPLDPVLSPIVETCEAHVTVTVV